MSKATVTKVDKRLIVKERKLDGILSYDVDNNYPIRVRDIVNASTIGRSCVSIYKKFIYGNGFLDKRTSEYKVSEGLTMDNLLYREADSLSYNGGVAIHVNYNALFEISEINFQPIAQIRFTTIDSDYPNMYAIHKDWSNRIIRKSDIIYINKFNPNPSVIQREVDAVGGWMNYRGQILYYSSDPDQYPLAIYDASLEDMQTDYQIKTFKFRQVTTNFLASHMLVTDPTETGNDEYNTYNRDKSQLTLNFEEFQGADNAGKIIVVEKSHPDQKFELTKIDQQNGDKLFEWTENSIRENIRQCFMIPSVLLSAIPGKLGTSDEIIDASKYYNSITETERGILTGIFIELSKYYHDKNFQLFNFEIEPKKIIDTENIPDNLINDLTINERRALVGYKPIINATNKTLADIIGNNGIQSLINIITNQGLNNLQKINTIQLLFNISENDAKKMLNDGINNISANTAV